MKYMECVECAKFGPVKIELKISGHIDAGEVRGFEARLSTLGGHCDVTDMIQDADRELLERRLLQLWDAWVMTEIDPQDRHADRAYENHVARAFEKKEIA